MMASVWGFKDSNWAVRNSSMMLFSSVTQRAVGGEKNVGMCKATFTPGHGPDIAGRSTHRAATVQAFFQLHSRLHPFLLGELDIATKHSGTSHNSEDQDKEEREPVQSEGRVPQMHPVLYPILLLLARLRSDGNEWDSASTSNEVTGSRETSAAADFVPMILRCRSNPHYLARVASARALAALVPPDRVPGIVADLAGGLPNDPSALLHAGAHNHVHGTLLQMLELIRALHIGQVAVPKGHPSGGEGINMSLERPLRSSSIITKLIAAGVEVTLQQVWLADPVKSLSPSIRALTLKVLEAFALCKKPGSNNYYSPGALGIVEDPGLALEAALHSAQNANTVHALQRQPSVLKSIVPGQSLLISSCVHEVVRRTICQQVMSTNGRGHVMAAERKGGIGVVDLHLELGSCLALISSTDCDVRDAAIKGVKRALRGSIGVDEMDKRERCRSGNITPSDGPGGRSRECIDQLQEMWEQVARAVPNEPHPPNVRRLLRILCRIGAHLKVQNAWGGSTTTGVGKDTVDLSKAGTTSTSLCWSSKFWAYLRTQCLDGKGRGGDIHANALEVMGFLLSSDAEHHETLGDGENDGIAEEWLDLVEEGADPEQPVAVRLATAASIAASGVQQPNGRAQQEVKGGTKGDIQAGRFLVRVWFVVIILLQDDDSTVREYTAHECMGDLGTTLFLGNGGERVVGPTCLDVRVRGGRVTLHAVQLVLSWLTAMAENTPQSGIAEALFLALLRIHAPRVKEAMNVLMSFHGGSAQVQGEADRGNICKGQGNLPLGDETVNGNPGDWEIFEEEQSNQHEEPALFAFMTVPHLHRVLLVLVDNDKSISNVIPALVLSCWVDMLSNICRGLQALPEALHCQPNLTHLPGNYELLMGALQVGAVLVSSAGVSQRTGKGSVLEMWEELPQLTREVRVYAEASMQEVIKGGLAVHPEVSNALTALALASQGHFNWDQYSLGDGTCLALAVPLGSCSPFLSAPSEI